MKTGQKEELDVLTHSFLFLGISLYLFVESQKSRKAYLNSLGNKVIEKSQTIPIKTE